MPENKESGKGVYDRYLKTHTCTQEELGLIQGNGDPKFWPLHKNSKPEVETYWKKLQCIDADEDVQLNGDYNSYKARVLA